MAQSTLVTRSGAENLLKCALSDLDCVIMEEPSLRDACRALKDLLRSALQHSQKRIDEAAALEIMGRAFVGSARSQAIPLSMQSSMENAARSNGHWNSGRVSVHDRRLKDIQTSLVSIGCEILGIVPPDPAIQCDNPIPPDGLRRAM